MTITLKPKCPAPTLEAVQETKAFSSTCGEREEEEILCMTLSVNKNHFVYIKAQQY